MKFHDGAITKKPYRVWHKRKKRNTVLPKFWDFLVKLAQKGAMSLTELMENVTFCGAECSVGSCGSSGGTSMYGFTGTSPPILINTVEVFNESFFMDANKRRRVMKKIEKKKFSHKNIISRTGKFLKNKKTLAMTVVIGLLMIAASCKPKPKPKDCDADQKEYNNAAGIAGKDSLEVVAYFDNYQTDAPKGFKDLIKYFMQEEKMTEEQAWEAAFCNVREYPEYYNKETNDYVNTFWGLIDQFNKHKEIREGWYKSWQDCLEDSK